MQINVARATMVLVDVVNYSIKACVIEDTLGAAALSQLNSIIQAKIAEALSTVDACPEFNIVMTTGDGALMHFETADQALGFAISLLDISEKYNLVRSDPLSQILFRVGIGTGDVAVDTEATVGNGLAGKAIIRAARLESQADHQGVLIDSDTRADASPISRAAFNGPEVITAKNGEAMTVYRYHLIGSFNSGDEFSNADLSSSPDRTAKRNLVKQVITKLNQLTRATQIQMLESGLAIPFNQRPPNTLTIEARALGILQWSEAEKQLMSLNAELIDLLGKV